MVKIQARFISTLQESLDCACAAFWCNLERYKTSINCRILKGRGRIGTDDNVFIDVSDGLTETP